MSFVDIVVNVFTVENILLCLAGVVLGIIFGAIPGLNTPMATALVLPFTYSMPIYPSVALLLGVYMGGISGGLISAILLKIPGTAAAATTTLDGYPMTKKGMAAEALSMGTFASFFGGIFSAIVLLFLAPQLAKVALTFSPWDYFGTIVFSLSLISSLMTGRVLKGLIVVFIGLAMSCIGLSPIDGMAVRFTFGLDSLNAGLQMILVIIGIFAFPEVYNAIGNIKDDTKPSSFRKKFFYTPERKVIKAQLGNLLRSSVIGTFIGILPGMGSSTAGILAYTQAKRLSKKPEEFGTGCYAGIAAPESANNAVTGGALIPMLTLAVPGDTTTAIIMAALLIQGINCGPLLIMNQPDLFTVVVILTFIANIFMFLVQSSTIRLSAKIVEIPRNYMFPVIMVFCISGAIALNHRVFDAGVLLVCSLIGYLLEKNDYPTMPLVLAFVLGSLMEQYLRRSLQQYGTLTAAASGMTLGTWMILLAIIMPIVSIVLDNRRKKKAAAAAAAQNAGTDEPAGE